MINLREFTLRLSQVTGLGPVTYIKLVQEYGTLENIAEKYQSRTLDTRLIHNIDSVNLETLLQQIQDAEIQYVCVWEKEYPQYLAQVPDAPIVLFYKGNLASINTQNLISVVGSRKLADEAVEWTESIVADLVGCGWGIVSGMAMGIDCVAHESALKANGYTVAVLPSPIDNPLPRVNEYLFNKILAAGGCVISEYAPGIATTKGMFAARNRVVAGVSRATLVTLAGEQSGSLITASCAFDYGREVFAFPGNRNQPLLKGCNNLIRAGKAKLIEQLSDVLVEFDQWSLIPSKQGKSGDLANKIEVEPELKDIYDSLAGQALSADELVMKFDRNITDVISLLMQLQIKGLVKNLDNDKFVAVIQ